MYRESYRASVCYCSNLEASGSAWLLILFPTWSGKNGSFRVGWNTVAKVLKDKC
jgi:hypothetical protein